MKAMAVKRAQPGSARKVPLSISIESVLTRVSHKKMEPMAPEQMRLTRTGGDGKEGGGEMEVEVGGGEAGGGGGVTERRCEDAARLATS